MTFPLMPMLPTLSTAWPTGEQWIYEIKYDGYRGQLFFKDHDHIELYSRNLNHLNNSFPEVITYAANHLLAQEASPCVLDGEICILQSHAKADFSLLQKRGRLKKAEKISRATEAHPATFVVFDILLYQGTNLTTKPLVKRKQILDSLLLPKVDSSVYNPIQIVSTYTDPKQLWNAIEDYRSEGMVAKKLTSPWQSRVRTNLWQKIKNYQSGIFFITALNKSNGYFNVGLIRDERIVHVGLFSHGLTDSERETLIQVIKDNKEAETDKFISIRPSICVELNYIDWYQHELREPRFSQFRLDWHWEDCTWEKMTLNKFK